MGSLLQVIRRCWVVALVVVGLAAVPVHGMAGPFHANPAPDHHVVGSQVHHASSAMRGGLATGQGTSKKCCHPACVLALGVPSEPVTHTLVAMPRDPCLQQDAAAQARPRGLERPPKAS